MFEIIHKPSIPVMNLYRAMPLYGFEPTELYRSSRWFSNKYPGICFKYPTVGWLVYLEPLIEGLLTGDVELTSKTYKRIPHLSLAKSLQAELNKSRESP